MTDLQSLNPRQHTQLSDIPEGMHPSAYYSSVDKYSAALACYRHFVRPGDLVFDIGANYGSYVVYFLALGCRVIALEPVEEVRRLIDERALIVPKAVGAHAGEATIQVGSNLYMSTLRHDVAQAGMSTMAGLSYSERTVPVTTLDELISEHGVPAFCKIDVEGFEAEILRGLSTPLPALSFEIHPWDTAKTGACVAELQRLGDYSLVYSPGEGFLMQPFENRREAIFGDVYATLRP